jgi:hypothetical protein
MALGHAVDDKVEAACRRGELPAKRVPVTMNSTLLPRQAEYTRRAPSQRRSPRLRIFSAISPGSGSPVGRTHGTTRQSDPGFGGVAERHRSPAVFHRCHRITQRWQW